MPGQVVARWRYFLQPSPIHPLEANLAEQESRREEDEEDDGIEEQRIREAMHDTLRGGVLMMAATTWYHRHLERLGV